MDRRTDPFSNLPEFAERRRCARYTLETKGISFGAGAGESDGVVLNLSESGMAVLTEANVEPGSVQYLRLELPQQAELLDVEGVVVWIDQENKRIGIKFQNLSDHVERCIYRWADHHTLNSQLKGILYGSDRAAPPPGLPVPELLEPLSPESVDQVPAMDQVPAIPPEVRPEVRRSRRLTAPMAAIAALLCLVFLGVGAYWGIHAGKAGGSAVASGPVSTPMLRLAGSNTIGSKLAPALAQAFLKQLGASDIRILPGSKADEQAVQGVLPGTTTPVQIQIAAHGSATAFENLMNASCDIGMASRKIKPEELSNLAALGDLSSPAGEHVLGLDGIAVIVSSSNPLPMLTKDQLAGIFSGTIVDWSQVSGQPGAIHVYARDDKSGTYDTFRTLVLGSQPLAATARRFEDSQALSDAVAGDPNGIGFIGLPYILSAKAIAVAELGATAFQPNRLTVGTEDYPLSRRLYLYTPANPQNNYVRRFVEFALSKAGQDVVGDVGFIAQNVISEHTVISPAAPVEYRRLTQGAGRLSLDFRFLPGFAKLDNKALTDLDRVVSFLSNSGYSGDNVLLLGFADNIGNRDVNISLSQYRARIVADEFARRGLKPATVAGFGPDLPVGANDTGAGRERNRRVEVWVKK